MPQAQWRTNLGFVLAATGSAVGLGNLWRFPGRAYSGGGGAFLLIYVLIVAFIGAAIMLAELTLGRATCRGAAGAFASVSRRFRWVGVFAVAACMLVLSCYLQVGGWVLYYVWAYATNASAVLAAPQLTFSRLLGAYGFPIRGALVFPALFLGLTLFLVLRGVERGIERFSKIAMPILALLLLVLLGRAVTLPGAEAGLTYLLTVDFSKLTFGAVLTALGQAFYSLSLGMAVLITYGAYVKKEASIPRSVAVICTFDTLIALLAAFMIVPAVFASGITPGTNGSFAFISLAALFSQLPGGEGFGFLFYLLLFFAAVTSAVSMLEGCVAFLTERFRLSRRRAACLVAGSLFVLGVFYTLSQTHLPLRGVWFDFKNGVQRIPFGDFLEFLADRLLIPVAAFFTCIFVGWVWGPRQAQKEITRNGVRFRCYRLWVILIRYVAPAAIILIFGGSLVFGMALS